MAGKYKKGRNLGAVDSWLDSIGLYRKNVAYDETCLFRAVSEQLFQSQIYHERVRRECVDYGRRYYYEFWDLLENEDDWYSHLDLLEKHMVFCGNVEIQIISHKYEYDVLLYDAGQQRVINATKRDYGKFLMLCQMNGDHFDAIYKKEHIQNAGFCQSIVYNILYENVFQVENVQDIVQGMLYKKEFIAASLSEINNNEKEDKVKIEEVPPAPTPPFPFKVAKALDPMIYRNIEYDTWTEVRREMRLGEWYYGDDNLILGTRCIYNNQGNTYECYIQEIIKNENKCVVYVTKMAQKLTVNYSDLSPENDAKPWPLPYRFAKNLVVSTPSQSPENKPLKLPKKRKDKRRLKSNSESSAQSQAANRSDTPEQDIKAFIGVPLQMHNNSYETCSPPESTPETSHSQHNLLVTPDVPSPAPKFSWEAPWGNYAQTSSPQVVWPHPSPPSHYQTSPMIASAPVTPDVIPYHGSRYPFVYNYHMENYPYNSWVSEYATPQDSVEESEEKAELYEPQMFEERPSLATSLPTPPQVEMYSPVIPVPGTPVMYSPEIPEMMMQPPPMQVYTPPVEMPYSGPFIYTPTPPTGWYPPGITAQGFTFPAPVNQNIQERTVQKTSAQRQHRNQTVYFQTFREGLLNTF